MVVPTFGNLLVIIGDSLLITRLYGGTGLSRIAHPAGMKKGAMGALFQDRNQRLSRRFLSAFLWCDIKRRFLLT